MVCLLAWMAVAVQAQTTDAFSDVLPVTDPVVKRSLNGEWQLKVVEGITEDPIYWTSIQR